MWHSPLNFYPPIQGWNVAQGPSKHSVLRPRGQVKNELKSADELGYCWRVPSKNVILASQRWRKEDQKVRVILGCIASVEANLGYIRLSKTGEKMKVFFSF